MRKSEHLHEQIIRRPCMSTIAYNSTRTTVFMRICKFTTLRFRRIYLQHGGGDCCIDRMASNAVRSTCCGDTLFEQISKVKGANLNLKKNSISYSQKVDFDYSEIPHTTVCSLVKVTTLSRYTLYCYNVRSLTVSSTVPQI